MHPALGVEQHTQRPDLDSVTRGVWDFIRKCARDDGGYAPSPDPNYGGNSDTASSDLAAVTYAAVLARTMGWELPHADQSVVFIQGHQQRDGRFVSARAPMDRHNPSGELLATLYNTTQGTVALRALGTRPGHDPVTVVSQFFEHDAYQGLPWYTSSFFPLLYAAAGRPFPAEYERTLANYLVAHQAEDGYAQDHVAATFHLAHFFRLINRPVPRAREMVARTLRDQKSDGGWNIKAPDWDVHACFDAMFILRQLGGNDPAVKRSMAKGAAWALRCRNADGGFGHYPGRHSDMDAVYFNFGSVIQAGLVRTAPLPDEEARSLGWGHVMRV